MAYPLCGTCAGWSKTGLHLYYTQRNFFLAFRVRVCIVVIAPPTTTTMNRLDDEEINRILENADILIEKVGEAACVVDNINSDLPDFNELQKYDETARVGYRIEDIEIALANASQELSDALNHIDALKRMLGKKS